jgi:uncharacterized protein YbcI
MSLRVAQAAEAFQQEQTGHRPESVSVVLNEDTLVITIRGALSQAEKAMATTPAGAAQVEEFHRRLFETSADSLRAEIRRITGVDVRESTAEITRASGGTVHTLLSGTVVQVFQLDRRIPPDDWSADGAQQD